jgi:AcrR family transcriptional regulator
MSVRPPQQQRSRVSLERVLNSAVELLAEVGLERFTIAEVCERSGVSIGAIYGRFGSKETVLHAAHTHAMSELSIAHTRFAVVGPQVQGSAREGIVETIRVLGGITKDYENRLRPFMHLAAVDEVIEKAGSEAVRRLGHLVTDTILRYRDDLTHPDPEMAADVCFRMAFSTFARRVMYGPVFESDRDMTWDDQAVAVGEACAALLLWRPAQA